MDEARVSDGSSGGYRCIFREFGGHEMMTSKATVAASNDFALSVSSSLVGAGGLDGESVGDSGVEGQQVLQHSASRRTVARSSSSVSTRSNVSLRTTPTLAH